jgi:hypothetical protein
LLIIILDNKNMKNINPAGEMNGQPPDLSESEPEDQPESPTDVQ